MIHALLCVIHKMNVLKFIYAFVYISNMYGYNEFTLASVYANQISFFFLGTKTLPNMQESQNKQSFECAERRTIKIRFVSLSVVESNSSEFYTELAHVWIGLLVYVPQR